MGIILYGKKMSWKLEIGVLKDNNSNPSNNTLGNLWLHEL
jgi:hypothetical protein